LMAAGPVPQAYSDSSDQTKEFARRFAGTLLVLFRRSPVQQPHGFEGYGAVCVDLGERKRALIAL
jgi:hypothetical protein